MIRYAVIGAGWRSEFYLRIAALMPEKFEVSGIYIRNGQKRGEFQRKYKVKITESLEELLSLDFDFAVSCVSKDQISEMLKILSEKDIPVLTETPVSDKSLSGRIQVSEQFHLMPKNQALKKIIESGILGDITQVKLSCCHDYHAVSLIRFFLNTGFEIPKIKSFSLCDSVSRYNGRNGRLKTPQIVNSEEKIRIYQFKNKTAIYDFSYEQYFSDIRRSQIIIRGTNGEIIDNSCTYLKGNIPVTFDIKRNSSGQNENLDGFSLSSLTAEGNILYENPFKSARFSDEEIAIGTALCKMKEFTVSGKEFYSVKEAAFDYKLSAMT